MSIFVKHVSTFVFSKLLNNVEGQGPPPASKDDIDKLETVKVTAEETGKY